MCKNSFAFVLLLGCLRAEAQTAPIPSFREVRDSYQSSEGRLFDRSGRLLQEKRLRWNVRALDWVELSQISSAMLSAAISVEDRRFHEHGVVDFRALVGALWQNTLSGSSRGASTISMQLVSLLEENGLPRRGRRSLWGKVRQAQLAWKLESEWTKEQILEAYLNLVSFRGEHRGVLSAARALFGKDPHGLDLRESLQHFTLVKDSTRATLTCSTMATCARSIYACADREWSFDGLFLRLQRDEIEECPQWEQAQRRHRPERNLLARLGRDDVVGIGWRRRRGTFCDWRGGLGDRWSSCLCRRSLARSRCR